MLGWIFIAAALFVLIMLAVTAKKSRDAVRKLPIESHECTCRRKECEDAIDTNGVTRKQYAITFECGDDEIRCAVPFKVFDAIGSNAKGVLEHRGTYFVSFSDGVNTIYNDK